MQVLGQAYRVDLSQVIYCGGYSGGVPPLPIPNREVKPAIADGTAPPGGRVGSCRSSKARLLIQSGLFVSVSLSNPFARESSFMAFIAEVHKPLNGSCQSFFTPPPVPRPEVPSPPGGRGAVAPLRLLFVLHIPDSTAIITRAFLFLFPCPIPWPSPRYLS